ncbi:hypothetical protein [Polaromonas sp.]|uniref:hypothetical protein n=1 Tax=Polaromonas sp. TaxID=1869339 RepID=UPI003569B9DF
MDIDQLITDKQDTLAKLKRAASDIEAQLVTLRAAAAAAKPTEFELMLKKPTVSTGSEIFQPTQANPILDPVKIVPAGNEKPRVDLFAGVKNTERVRNPKGSVDKIARLALTQEKQTLDALEVTINSRAEKPVSRAAVRTLMMNLKKDGYAVSDAPGVFRLAEKGEAATDSRSVTASSATESSGSN